MKRSQRPRDSSEGCEVEAAGEGLRRHGLPLKSWQEWKKSVSGA
jgi:hypothetical protein